MTAAARPVSRHSSTASRGGAHQRPSLALVFDFDLPGRPPFSLSFFVASQNTTTRRKRTLLHEKNSKQIAREGYFDTFQVRCLASLSWLGHIWCLVALIFPPAAPEMAVSRRQGGRLAAASCINGRWASVVWSTGHSTNALRCGHRFHFHFFFQSPDCPTTIDFIEKRWRPTGKSVKQECDLSSR